MHPLLALQVHLRDHPREALPGNLVHVLLPALQAFADGEPFEKALSADACRRQRSALRRAAELLDDLGTDNRRAQRLAGLVARSMRPDWRPSSEADHALAAAKAARPVPTSARRLFDLIRTD